MLTCPPTRPVPRDRLYPGLSLLSVMQLWVIEMSAVGLRQRTIRERVAIVQRCAAFNGMQPESLTRDAAVAFLAQDGLKSSSRSTYWGALWSWFAWLVLRGVRDVNPLATVPRPRVPRGLPRPLTTAQVRAVLALRMWPSTRAQLLLMAYQGMRVHEVAHLRGEEVDRLGMTITVRGKGGVVDVLPLHPRVAEIAAQMPASGWWFPSPADSAQHVQRASVSAGISRVMRRAGVNGTAHQLRHWYATELVRAGANLKTVQGLMRHASLATTERYVLVADERSRAAVDRLPDIEQQEEGEWS